MDESWGVTFVCNGGIVVVDLFSMVGAPALIADRISSYLGVDVFVGVLALLLDFIINPARTLARYMAQMSPFPTRSPTVGDNSFTMSA